MNRVKLFRLSLNIVLFVLFSGGATAANYKTYADSLLKVWCDGMIEWQVNNDSDPEIDGSLFCDACGKIHGRCLDAVYPFMYMYNKTHDERYLNAAIDVMIWSENVTADDGSWTVIPNPNSWKGITVFGAVSLAETLAHYDHLLPEDVKLEWQNRLMRAGNYIYDNFTLTFTNINYGISAIYAMYLLGEYLDEPRFIEKSRELTVGVEESFTEKDALLWGEGKPYDKLSPKGLHAVDLGYNVEETLNALALYAVDTNNEALQELAIKSMRSHLEFMLPDGGWDNSWGSRQYKWSYWGSRTTEGSFPGYGALADQDPAFAEAVYRHTMLLERCTDPKYGLISGGLHYHTHGIKPCIHHTFTHAKALASLLDRDIDFAIFDRRTSLPRDVEQGVVKYDDVDTWLISKDDWRATVTSYDFLYTKGAQQATGGSLAMLYHTKVGAILTASLAEYTLIEENNQQINDEPDIALTPRIEVLYNGRRYSNLFDHTATVECNESGDTICFKVRNTLYNNEYNSPEDCEIVTSVECKFKADGSFQYSVELIEGLQDGATAELILPVICSSDQRCEQISSKQINIHKPNGVIEVESNYDFYLKSDISERIFNMVPGVEALPLYISLIAGQKASVTIEVK